MGDDFSDTLVKRAMEQRREAFDKAERAETSNKLMVSQMREVRAAAAYLMGESAWDPRTSRSHPWRVTEKAMDRLEAAVKALPVKGGTVRGQEGE